MGSPLSSEQQWEFSCNLIIYQEQNRMLFFTRKEMVMESELGGKRRGG